VVRQPDRPPLPRLKGSPPPPLTPPPPVVAPPPPVPNELPEPPPLAPDSVRLRGASARGREPEDGAVGLRRRLASTVRRGLPALAAMRIGPDAVVSHTAAEPAVAKAVCSRPGSRSRNALSIVLSPLGSDGWKEILDPQDGIFKRG
jgi:hypothetical protein